MYFCWLVKFQNCSSQAEKWRISLESRKNCNKKPKKANWIIKHRFMIKWTTKGKKNPKNSCFPEHWFLFSYFSGILIAWPYPSQLPVNSSPPHISTTGRTAEAIAVSTDPILKVRLTHSITDLVEKCCAQWHH